MISQFLNQYSNIEQTWFALVSHYEGMHKEVYQHIAEHEVQNLYLSTSLEDLKDRSPLVVCLNHHDPLVNVLPKENTLYFSASKATSFKQVLAQLRLRLQIQFSGDRKGIFHYYHPSVASYFLGLSNKEETSRWLGCFSGVCFYNQVISSNEEWVYREGGEQMSSSIWLLTQSQEHALKEKFVEQKIKTWADSEKLERIDWQKQKCVSTFCSQHRIEATNLIHQLRCWVQRYDLSQEQLNLPLNAAQTPESVVEHIEQLLLKEGRYV